FFTWVLGFSSLRTLRSLCPLPGAPGLIFYLGLGFLFSAGCPRFDFLPGSWVSLFCKLRALRFLQGEHSFTLSLFHSFTLSLFHSFTLSLFHSSSPPRRLRYLRFAFLFVFQLSTFNF